MTEAKRKPGALRMGKQPPRENARQLLSRAPDEMKARRGISARVQAAVGPERHGEKAHAEPFQPVISELGAAVDGEFGPALRPQVVSYNFV